MMQHACGRQLLSCRGQPPWWRPHVPPCPEPCTAPHTKLSVSQSAGWFVTPVFAAAAVQRQTTLRRCVLTAPVPPLLPGLPRPQVPPTVYMWPMVAFATAVLLNLLSMAMERRPVKRQLCFLNVYISGSSPLRFRPGARAPVGLCAWVAAGQPLLPVSPQLHGSSHTVYLPGLVCRRGLCV